MAQNNLKNWISKPKTNQILISFSIPRTLNQVEKKLGIKQLKLKPYLENNLLLSLNSNGKKGIFYTLTDKARKLLKLPKSAIDAKLDWNLISFVLSSPKQRLVFLKKMNGDSEKTSEEIRKKCSALNPLLHRSSAKTILKELTQKGLVESKLIGRKRYYWLNNFGREISNRLQNKTSTLNI